MPHVTDEIIEEKRQKREKGFSFLQVLFLILLVLLAAIYMGETLFGENSLEVLNALKKQQKILDTKIKRISHENAILQKKYFELKALMPDVDEDTPQK